MFKRKESDAEIIDAVAAEITRSAAVGDDESEAAVSSPHFFARLSARIESEKRGRQAEKVRPIAPALAIGNIKLALSGLTLAAAVAFWLIRIPTIPGRAADAGLPNSQAALTACSISATSACAISTGDVLQLLLSNNNTQELPK
jgi:hypothetical protein